MINQSVHTYQFHLHEFFKSPNSQNMDSSINTITTAPRTIRVRVPIPASSKYSSRSSLLQNYFNLKNCSEISRIMYYGNGSWVDFDGGVVSILRSELAEGKHVVEADVDGLRYLFDFIHMLQVDIFSGNERSIAWIDVKGKCFFPKLFVGYGGGGDDDDDKVDFAESNDKLNDGGCGMEVDIEVRINGRVEQISLGKRKREVAVLNHHGDEEQSDESCGASCSDNVESLSKRPHLDSPRWCNTKLVKEDERVNAVVRKLFLAGVKSVDPTAKVTSIHQCVRTGAMERARCEVFRKQIDITKDVRGAANAKFAWYGTSAKGVESILLHGFGIPITTSRTESHGAGIYLSPVSLPHLSAMQSEVGANGEKHVILCRVILGNVEKVEAGSHKSHPSSANFDTGVDDLRNPKRYVIWYANMNTHIIPECVVSFTSSDNLSGCVGESTPMKFVPNATNSFVWQLFSKLKSSLSSEKVRELQSLCSVYKAGNLAKDTFIKKLRGISGDQILHSTIREFQYGSK